MHGGFWIRLAAGAVSAAMLAGCASEGTVGGSKPASGPSSGPTTPAGARSSTPSALAHHPPQPLTGTQLSDLITPPDGFTVSSSGSTDSGSSALTPTPINVDPTTITCSDWWNGQGQFGSGVLAFTTRNFQGPSSILTLAQVSIFPEGKATGETDASVAIMKRCTHFTYKDRKTSAPYLVDVSPGPELKLGDRAWTFDATEKATDGTIFPVQITYVQIGDAFLLVTEDSAGSPPPDRAKLPIATWVGALQAAGY